MQYCYTFYKFHFLPYQLYRLHVHYYKSIHSIRDAKGFVHTVSESAKQTTLFFLSDRTVQKFHV